jgi:hypothetical protein
MPARRLLETSSATWGELFSNGKRYTVPAFQRDYAWGEDEWSELWRDLLSLREPDAAHYMGTVVLRVTDGGAREIIDGQQRLATLSIVALALIAAVERLASDGVDVEANQTRARLLRDRLIRSRHPASLAEESRLRLNQHDDGFFRSYLVQLHEHPAPARLRGSHQRLWRAYQYFAERARVDLLAAPGVVGGAGARADGAALATFLMDQVADGVQFIVIQVPDEVSAYTVFETLNARGLQLTATDLLKNYVFSLVARTASDLELMELKWGELIARVGMERFPDFAYHYLVSRDVEARKQRLFAHIRALVRDGRQAFEWLDDMLGAAAWYTALDDPHDEHWTDMPKARQHVRSLVLFRVDQYKPLVLALRGRLRDGSLDVEQLLRMCVVVSLRANVLGRVNTADVLRAYQSAVRHVRSAPSITAKQIFEALRSIYVPDDELAQSLATLTLDTHGARKKLVKYLLVGVEEQLSGRAVDWETDPATIEHILPESPDGSWRESFSEVDLERFTMRLGNLTLLEASKNRALGAADMATKAAEYATSRYACTSSIQATEWAPAAIERRQRELSRTLCERFRLDF